MWFILTFMSGVLFVGYGAAKTQEDPLFSGGGTIKADGTYSFDEGEYFRLNDTTATSILHLKSICKEDTGSFSVLLYNVKTSSTILFDKINCSETTSSSKYSNPLEFKEDYNIRVFGKPDLSFEIEVNSTSTSIDVNKDGVRESMVTLSKGSRVVESFFVNESDIEATSGSLTYIQVTVESNDKFVEDPDGVKNVKLASSWSHGCGPGSVDGAERIVGKLMVTQTPGDLEAFFDNPNAVIFGSMRLSFSCFGMITISNASEPVLKHGKWLVGVTLDHQNYTVTKDVKIKVSITTDYQYVDRIIIIFLVSLIGIIIPFLAHIIFDAGNIHIFEKNNLKVWLQTTRDWLWRGDKGGPYLVAILACLLIVSAFQVVNARHYGMTATGDRDLCYYNEKCYRPYGHYYDVSVNGLASNLPFMVHGVLLVLFFSIEESYCKNNKHEHYDYSLPYSIGFTFICEGFGSLLYHICPSQIIFQFDTLFMFVISLIMIIAIYEGLSIRDNDLKYSRLAKQKALRPIKVFAFFIGPVYFFNFIGNLNATRGLPIKFMVPFYVLFGLWWVCILCWLAYKNDLLPESWNPKDVPEVTEEDGVDVDGFRRGNLLEWAIRNNKAIKAVIIGVYCIIVIVGFVFAVLQKVAFSIFILGVLILALVVMAIVNFVPVAGLVVGHFSNFPLQLTKNCCDLSKHVLVLLGMLLFLLVGCVVILVSLVFFVYFTTTDKALDPWLSREYNNPCFLNGFYDTHDFWHLFASFGLMIMAMVVTQISKPCRECYLVYMKINKEDISRTRDMFGTTQQTKVAPGQRVSDTST